MLWLLLWEDSWYLKVEHIAVNTSTVGLPLELVLKSQYLGKNIPWREYYVSHGFQVCSSSKLVLFSMQWYNTWFRYKTNNWHFAFTSPNSAGLFQNILVQERWGNSEKLPYPTNFDDEIQFLQRYDIFGVVSKLIFPIRRDVKHYVLNLTQQSLTSCGGCTSAIQDLSEKRFHEEDGWGYMPSDQTFLWKPYIN